MKKYICSDSKTYELLWFVGGGGEYVGVKHYFRRYFECWIKITYLSYEELANNFPVFSAYVLVLEITSYIWNIRNIFNNKVKTFAYNFFL